MRLGPSDGEPSRAAEPPQPEPPGAQSVGIGLRGPGRAITIIALIGLIVTASLSWTAWRIDRNSEHRLLQVQTKQAEAVVASAIISVQSPLQTAVDIAAATDGNTRQFAQYMAGYTGPSALFVATSLWQTTNSGPIMVASTGVPLGAPAAGAALVVRASHSATFVVAGIATDSRQGVGYALANPKNSTFTVYAERAIPANRRVPVESDSAFADLHFATYLGPTTNLSALQTTDVATSHLPLTGDTARASIPFGDTTITLVTSPTGHLGGTIGAELPWLVVIVGLLLTAVTAFVAGRLVGRRRDTERDAQTITGLYERLDTLFAEQRTISETLQHALLPQRNPLIPNLEVASRYVAGAHGVDIGGDWYSIIQLDESRFGFVVGDVSGRGVDAATHMARIRFTLRAYLIEGHPPNVALELCARQLNIDVDGHFATVVIGTGDLTSQVVTLANAGHLNPLLITGRGAQVVETKVGPPLGVTTAAYELTTFAMEPGSTLMAFTDGLIERRDADIDLGFERLADATTTSTGRSVDDMLSAVLSVMSDYTGAEDDIAILAFRWTAPGPSSAPESLERPSSDLTSLTQ